MNNRITLALVALGSALLASVTTYGIVYLTEHTIQKNTQTLIRDYYATEAAVMVSPHGLRKEIDKGGTSFILVDLRSAVEYEKEHIVGAVNIPAYADPDTSAYNDVERIVGSFQTLKETHPSQDIVVYCYSTPCMTGRKIGHLLAEHDIYVKHLGIGWNEWRYFWTLWNHEHEWGKTYAEDYIWRGSEPGEKETPGIKQESSCGANDMGC